MVFPGVIQWGSSVEILPLQVGTALDQESRQPGLPRRRGQMQRGLAFFVFCLEIRLPVQEQCHDCLLAGEGCRPFAGDDRRVQGSHGGVILGVDVGAVGDQEFDDLRPSVEGGHVQRRSVQCAHGVELGSGVDDSFDFVEISRDDGIEQDGLGKQVSIAIHRLSDLLVTASASADTKPQENDREDGQ